MKKIVTIMAVLTFATSVFAAEAPKAVTTSTPVPDVKVEAPKAEVKKVKKKKKKVVKPVLGQSSSAKKVVKKK